MADDNGLKRIVMALRCCLRPWSAVSIALVLVLAPWLVSNAFAQRPSIQDFHIPHPATEPVTSTASARTELVFIDASVAHIDRIRRSVRRRAEPHRQFEIHIVNRQRHGIEQISEVLATYRDVDAVHIISHGIEGAIQLGRTRLSQDNVRGYADAIVGWQHALASGADVLFYGCELARNARGRRLLNTFQALTGADVAASVDATGHAEQGGNWVLEYTLGRIETAIIASRDLQATWLSVLAILTFQNGFNSYTSTVDTELDASQPNNDNGTNVEIELDDNPRRLGLLRFDNIFGPGANQIPFGAVITSASLTVNVNGSSAPGATISLHRMWTSWTENSSWNSMGSGIQFGDESDDDEARSVADSTLLTPDQIGSQTFTGLQAALQDWSNGDSNHGWAIVNDNAQPWKFYASNESVTAFRPILTVEFTTGITVTNTNNAGPGSLRQAIIDANSLGGTDTISFNIPRTDLNRYYYRDDGIANSLSLEATTALDDAFIIDFDPDYPGTPHSWYRIAPTSALPTITETVLIDGYTQTGARENTVAAPGLSDAILKIEINGDAASGAGLFRTQAGADFNECRGLVINGDFTSPLLLASHNNVVAGNYIGTDVTGTQLPLSANPINQYGVMIQSNGQGNTIGGTIPEDRNIIAATTADGVMVTGAGSVNNFVAGNFIGTDVTGTVALGSDTGVRLTGGANSNIIGGIGAAGNVIAGANTADIALANSSANTIQGNLIGTNASGFGPISAAAKQGIHIELADDTTIGGVFAGEGNVIAYHTEVGVRLDAAAGTGNSILGNSIFGNDDIGPGTGLGIDLGNDGVTANDVGDLDVGANDLQNAPVLTSANSDGVGTFYVGGVIHSTAVRTFRIEFFASTLADPSGNGEGEAYLGFTNVTTDVFGDGAYNAVLFTTVPVGAFITATATDQVTNNTSEFGAYVTALDMAHVVVDTTADVVDAPDTSSITDLLLDRGPDKLISLREAITAVNNTPNGASPDEIHFHIPNSDAGHLYYQDDSIPGLLSLVAATQEDDASIADFDPDYLYTQHSWFRIDLDAAQPQLELTDAVIIDGYTQPGALTNNLNVGDNARLRIELTDSHPFDNHRGLTIMNGADGSTIRGLVINAFEWSGIMVEPGANGNTIQGNFIGTDISGTRGPGNGDDGIQLRAHDNTVGGANTEDRNVMSGNANRGLNTFTFSGTADNNRIENNYIGTDASGTRPLGNAAQGVTLYNSDGATIRNNVIADNGSYGIWLRTSTVANNLFEGNLIGTDATGTVPLGNTSHGIHLSDSAHHNTFGDTAIGSGNLIAYNGGNGINLVDTFTDYNTIRGNSIFSNNGLGIDLNGDGVTPNDFGDGDFGPNNRQNFPVITSAVTNETDTLAIDGTLHSLGFTNFAIDFFYTLAEGGEGQTYLGSIAVSTGFSGTVNFSNVVFSPVAVPDTAYITATATVTSGSSAGNTSEFSTDMQVLVNNGVVLTTNAPLAIDEGATLTINDMWLSATDADNTPDQLVYTITSGPANGILLLASVPTASFTQDDLDNNRVEYQHDGGETNSDIFDFTVDDGQGSSTSDSFNITVTSVNDAPVHTLPPPQTTSENTTLTFASGNGNQILLDDVDAATSDLEMTLAVAHGTLELSTTTGLTFMTGDGSDDAVMTFQGELSEINAALNGLRFTPASNYAGPEILEIMTSDRGNSGAGGSLSARDRLSITVDPDANNNPPMHTVPGPQVTIEETPIDFTASTGLQISVNDDAAGNLIEVTLTALGGTVTLSTTAGTEFQVNTNIANEQQDAAVAMASNGDYIVVWQSKDQDADNWGIYAQQYNVEGIAQGNEFLVNTTTTKAQTAPAVAAADDGSFIVVWTSDDQDGNALGVFGQRFDADGNAVGNEFQVNTTFAKDQQAPTVAMDATGDFVVAWQSKDQDGDNWGIYAQRFDALGVAQGSEFLVNTTTAKQQINPAVAMDATGDFVVAWQSEDQDGDNWGIYAQRYNASGVAQGSEFLVNSITFKEQMYPAIAMDDAGDVVMAWQSKDVDYPDNKEGIYAQRYDSSGTAIGGQFLVNTTTPHAQSNPTIAMDGAGNFVVAWQAQHQDHPDNREGIYAQRYDASNTALGGEFLVNTHTLKAQTSPAIALGNDGHFVVIWSSDDQDGDDTGVFGQRYRDIRELVFIVGDGVDDTTVTFRGTLDQINDALDGLVFTPDEDFDGLAQLTITTDDLGHSGAGGPQSVSDAIDITVDPINDAPVLNMPVAQNTPQGVPLVFSTAGGNAVSISDADAGANALQIMLNASGGDLTLGNTSGLSFSVGDGVDDETMTFTGTLADINAALDAMSFAAPANYAGPGSVQIMVDDQGNSGASGPLSDSATVFITVDPDATNGAPSVNIPGPQRTAPDTPITLGGANGNGASISDDANDNPVQVTMTITNGSVTLTNTIGFEQRVNTETNKEQQFSDLAITPSGDYVIVWQSKDADGDGEGIYGQQYNMTGLSVGPEFRINSTTAQDQTEPAVAINAAGSFIVVWTSEDQDGDGKGIYAQRFDASGTLLGNEFLVNTSISGNQTAPDVALDDSGNFTVVWQSADGAGQGVFAQVFDPAGVPLGAEFLVNTTAAGDQKTPAAAMDADGDFVVTWQASDGDGNGVFAQRFDASGTKVGVEFQVNTATAGDQEIPSIDMNAAGAFIIAWQGQDASGDGVFAQRYDAGGLPVGGEFLVNTTTADNERFPSVALNDNGEFAIFWEGQDANGRGVFGQLYEATGTALDSEFQANLTTSDDQTTPVAGIDITGYAVASWTSSGDQDGDREGVYTQRFLQGGAISFMTGDGQDDALIVLTAKLADVNAALDGMILTPSLGFTGLAQIQIDVDDQGHSGSGGALTDSDTIDIVVGNGPWIDLDADDSSGADGADFATTFVQGGGAVQIADSSDAQVDDPDSLNLTQLIVTLTNPLDGAAETLTADTSGTSITAPFAGNVLTLSGPDTPAAFQQVLRTVEYHNAAPTPNPSIRHIEFITDDGGFTSNVAIAAVSIVLESDSPTLLNNTGSLVSEGGTDTIANTELQYTDLQPPSSIVYTPTSGPENGQLELATAPGVALASFTQADIDAGQLVYRHNDSEIMSDSFNFDVDDGLGNVLAGQSFSFTITPQNDPPTAAITPVSYNVAENTPLTLHATGLVVNDVDAGSGTVRATLSVSEGALTGTAGSTGVTISGSTTNTLTLDGTLAQINDVFAGNLGATITYQATDVPSASAILTLDINDLGNIGSGGALSANDTATLTITAENDGPSGIITLTSYTAAEDGTLALHGTGLSVSDPDADVHSIRATLSVGEGSLSAAAGTTGATVAGSGTASLTLDGTLSQINDLLAGNLGATITYHADDDPTVLKLSVDDLGNTGGGSLTHSDTASIDIGSLVNDPPTAAITPASYNVAENTPLTLHATGLAVSDVDAGVGAVRATLSVSEGALTGTAGSTAVTISGSTTNTLTLDGTLAQINDVFAGNLGATITYQATDVPSASAILTLDINDLGNIGSGGALSANDTATLTITSENDRPTSLSLAQNTIIETTDTRSGHTVGTLASIDLDGDDTATYSIVGGAHEALFSIGEADTLVLADGILDFETRSTYNVTVRVMDSGGLTLDQTFAISVTNMATAITAGQRFTVLETASGLTPVGTTATTGDTPIHFAITSGDGDNAFSIDASGLLTLREDVSLDFDTTPSYTLGIEASDGTSTVSATVFVDIIDVTEDTATTDDDRGEPQPSPPSSSTVASPTITGNPSPPASDAAPAEEAASEEVTEPAPPAAESDLPAPSPPPSSPAPQAPTQRPSNNSPRPVSNQPAATNTSQNAPSSGQSSAGPVTAPAATPASTPPQPQTEPVILEPPPETASVTTSSTQPPSSPIESTAFLQALDELRDHVKQDEVRAHTVLGGTTAMATGLSIGYVLWLLRGGLLLSSLLTSLPAWRFVDPLPVLAHVAISSQTDTTDDESLETMVQQDDNVVEEIDA